MTTAIGAEKERASAYLNYLYHEISLLSPYLAQDRLITQIHFGGGTPNYLSTEQFREILDVIARHFHLSYPENLEVSIEIDPRYTDAQRTRELAQLGFNRISIGVQDYNHEVQTAINRVQSRGQVDTVITAARESDIQSISIDLISGLPLQTRESFADTLAQVVESAVADAIANAIAPTDSSATPPQARPESGTAAAQVSSAPAAAPEPQIVTRISTSGGRHWGINIGRYGSRHEAQRVLLKVALNEMSSLDGSLRRVVPRSGGFDANFMGLTRDGAEQACARLQARGTTCFMIGPD